MISLLAIVPGMLVALGVLLALLAFRPQYVRLDDALASLGTVEPVPAPEAAAPRDERLGAWWLRRRRVVPDQRMRRTLELRGRTLGRHYSLKLGWAIGLFVAPLTLGVVASLLGQDASVPLIAGLVGGVVGFLLPDLMLRMESDNLTTDATESLLTYFDLVTLERMANQSATQSLHAAAQISDNTVFVQIRGALERSRLEQRMPFGELTALGQRLEVPALVDLADVMRLDESGAALSSTLRARVRELRDAHLTELKMQATQVSERMTVFMVIPSMIFGLLILAPPILKLISG